MEAYSPMLPSPLLLETHPAQFLLYLFSVLLSFILFRSSSGTLILDQKSLRYLFTD